jgi:hypothetical protein
MDFKITWSSPKGTFGWTTMEECIDLDEAIGYWLNHLVGGRDVPIDAEIEQIEQLETV